MDTRKQGQVSGSAAAIYDEFYLPALFQQWAGRVVAAAEVQPKQRILDVACGTGVLAEAVAQQVGTEGTVVGLDCNEGMLAVARRKSDAIEWRHAFAEALPFADGSFDRVVSQFGLMFFSDQALAIREMYRVLRPGGRLAVVVWGALEESPGYAVLIALLRRLFGDRVADALYKPFNLGDRPRLATLFAAGGVPAVAIKTVTGSAHFPSINAWVEKEAKGWILGNLIDDEQRQNLLAAAEKELRPFVTNSNTVTFPMSAHMITESKT